MRIDFLLIDLANVDSAHDSLSRKTIHESTVFRHRVCR